MRREFHVRFCERAAVGFLRATHLVILSRGHAAEALAWTKAMMTKLGLTLNEAKTSVKDARTESFSFLGYSFGPHRYRKDGHWYLGASPSKKSVQRIKTKIGELLVPGNCGTWLEVRDRLNALLRGWSASCIEDIHAGVEPSSKTGHFSDAKLVTPYGEIPWNNLSRIRNDEMRDFMKQVVDRLYTVLLRLECCAHT